MTLEWWMWIVGGVVLIVAELAVPAFFIIWFGLGAVLVGLLSLLADFSPTTQVAWWIVTSLAMVALWFKVFKQSFHKTLVGTADGEVIGEIGLLGKPVAPFQRGRVRFQKPLLGAEEWECLADEEIAAGERVRVTAIEGSFIRVTRA